MATRPRSRPLATIKEGPGPLGRLSQIELRLQAAGPASVLPFHRVYTLVTAAVLRAAEAGAFEQSNRTLRQVDRFLDYYEEALDAGRTGRFVPPAWSRLFALSPRRHRRMLALALCVNAHISNDLPQALRDLGTDLSARRDYFLISRIIAAEYGSIISAARISLGPLNVFVRLGMSLVLRLWRRRAWTASLALSAGKIPVSSIEASAARTARLLTRVPWPR